MSQGQPRARLRRARKERGWSQEAAVKQAKRMLALYRSVATGDAIPPAVVGLDVRQLARWENGEVTPRPGPVWLLAHLYGRSPEELDLPSFDDDADREPDTVAEPTVTTAPGTRNIRRVERRDFLKQASALGFFGLSHDQLSQLITAVAHESRSHVTQTEQSNLGPATLEQLASDVARLSRAIVSQPPIPVYTELVDLRDTIYELLSGRQHPTQTADLYLLAGQTCAMLANASLDLGQPTAAADLARATWAYGELIGHDTLRAFGRATQSLIAYWTGAYRDAIDYAQSGQSVADSPNVRSRLMALEARARAKLGTDAHVVELVERASETIELADSWASIGGHLEFTEAKLNYYATNALADQGRYAEAIGRGERTLLLYQSTPADLRSYGDEAGCHVALAEVSVRQGTIDGATARLAPVLAHPHAGHIQLLRDMLGGLRRQLTNPSRRSRESLALVERLDSF